MNLRTIIGTALFTLSLSMPAWAGPCDGLKLDLAQGVLTAPGGSVGLKSKLDEIKKILSCASESSESMAGASLYYAQQGLLLAPGRMITVMSLPTPFKGSLSQNILNKTSAEVEALLGAADYSAQEETETAGSFYTHAFYIRPWGTLMLKYSPKDKLEEVSLSSDSIEKWKKQFPAPGDMPDVPGM